MIHRMTPLSNPRLFLFFGIVILLPVLGIFSFKAVSSYAGAAIAGLAFWISYRLYRFARPFLSTQVTTAEAGVTCTLPGEGDVYLPWEEIALSGRCTVAGGKPFLFLYHKGRDKLITIPYEYEDMQGLQTEFERTTPFETFHFEGGRTLRDVLRERFPEVLDVSKSSQA